jgi:hypothetical protein
MTTTAKRDNGMRACRKCCRWINGAHYQSCQCIGMRAYGEVRRVPEGWPVFSSQAASFVAVTIAKMLRAGISKRFRNLGLTDRVDVICAIAPIMNHELGVDTDSLDAWTGT